MLKAPFVNNQMIKDFLEKVLKENPKDYDTIREIETRLFGNGTRL